MRLKVGFILRSLLVIGTFLGLVVLWSSLSPKPSDENPFGKRDDSLLPKGDLADQFKPVVPWPHVEGVEVDLNSIRLKHGGADHPLNPEQQQPNQKQVIQQQYVTFRPHSHAYTSPILKKGILGNFEPKEPEPPGVLSGPGEGAKPFILGPEYKDSVQASIKEFGFNMVASDMISLDRTISDIRHEECKYWHYDDRLLTSSVVIVFHNEGWSTLMRTVHSVIKRTPRKYLAEIVMIDDYSNKVHLKERLEEYIKQWNGLVKLFRNEKREGLIQARSIGAKKAAKGQVLIYLDAHCEVGINWYAPLIAPISKDRTVCTVPLIDYIDGNEYSMEPQQGGDEDGLARGAWDWSLLWKRVPLSQREKAKRKYTTQPYRSPAMAGGLFAIEREFFFELGLYDPGLQIWGGENFEISYKIWQCGGQLLFVPCSRVGHIYRLQGWQGNPPPAHVGSSPTLKNYVRVVEVWWDEYKDYFYASRPETLTLAYGDISELKRFREEHRCKSFKWFMEEIAYDIPLHYPLPPKNVEWGEIRGFETSYCIDSMGHTNGGNVEIGPCHRMGGNQLFRINEANQLMQYDQCLTRGVDNSAVIITHCDQNQHTEWKYFKDLHRFTHVQTGKCLDRSDLLHKVFISDCDTSKTTQKWEMNNIVAV
ncbi:N-acetylgalactosaminyltransferase 7 isoform X2 [Seriola lalandi dorsalis]|uniref:N-acetylgalactosaminyltransferase 7 isoform X2 n=1 Tax=Seriola lalandi dorsalis TaxID=1841481 RepID=UPI000C6F562A|nr:N-acetylgalactosaminyltransferase 7 isoform X2 [Seriola lalandi dorsalis]XP_056227433.1 N-acetylgalactosaminyltransferase 7 isoform X2 [Seriola aureovittata]